MIPSSLPPSPPSCTPPATNVQDEAEAELSDVITTGMRRLVKQSPPPMLRRGRSAQAGSSDVPPNIYALVSALAAAALKVIADGRCSVASVLLALGFIPLEHNTPEDICTIDQGRYALGSSLHSTLWKGEREWIEVVPVELRMPNAILKDVEGKRNRPVLDQSSYYALPASLTNKKRATQWLDHSVHYLASRMHSVGIIIVVATKNNNVPLSCRLIGSHHNHHIVLLHSGYHYECVRWRGETVFPSSHALVQRLVDLNMTNPPTSFYEDDLERQHLDDLMPGRAEAQILPAITSSKTPLIVKRETAQTRFKAASKLSISTKKTYTAQPLPKKQAPAIKITSPCKEATASAHDIAEFADEIALEGDTIHAGNNSSTFNGTNAADDDDDGDLQDGDNAVDSEIDINQSVFTIANANKTYRDLPKECWRTFNDIVKSHLQEYYDDKLTICGRRKAFQDVISVVKRTLGITRGGKRHKAHNYIRNQLDAAKQRQQHSKPEPPLQPKTRFRAHQEDIVAPQAAAIKRCNTLYSAGYLGRAARALKPGGLADMSNPEVRAQMIQKHPTHELSEECTTLMNDASREKIVVVADKKLHNLVASMDRGASPGYDGWTERILLHTFRDPELFKLMARLLSDIVNDDLLPGLSGFLTPSVLIASSDKGKHRPIAMPSLFSKLASRIAAQSIELELAAYLEPAQVGPTQRSAAESIVLRIDESLKGGLATLKLDTSNAFNSMSRSHIMTQVMTLPFCRKIRSCFVMLYAQSSLLLVRNSSGIFTREVSLSSQQGVKQGDPLGGIGFALGLQPLLLRVLGVNDSQPLPDLTGREVDGGCAYHDDVFLNGHPADLMRVLVELKILMTNELDMSINASKSELIDWSFHTRDQSTKDAVEAAGVVVCTDSAEILGIPIARTTDLLQDAMKDKVASQLQVLDVMKHSDLSAQRAVRLTQVSTIHKLDYWMRAVDPEVMEPCADEFDEHIDTFLLEKIGHQHLDASDKAHALRIMHKSIRDGGFGITPVSHNVNTCYLAGHAAALGNHSLIDSLDAYADGQPRPDSTMHQRLQRAIDRYHKQIAPATVHLAHASQRLATKRRAQQLDHAQQRQAQVHNPVHAIMQQTNAANRAPANPAHSPHTRALSRVRPYTVPTTSHEFFERYSGVRVAGGSKILGLQHHLSQRITLTQCIIDRQHEATLPERSRQLAQASRAPEANRLLLVRPSANGSTDIDNTQFHDFCCIRFGLDFDPSSADGDCHACNTPNAILNNPTHYLNCTTSSLNAHIVHRHNDFRDLTRECVNAIGGNSIPESEFALDGTDVRSDGDWIVDGKRILWDNACVDPLTTSAPQGMLAASLQAETRKRAKYEQRAKEARAEFVPLVVELTGGFGADLRLFIKRLRNIASRKMIMVDPKLHIDSFQDQIACLLARHNSWIAQKGCSYINKRDIGHFDSKL